MVYSSTMIFRFTLRTLSGAAARKIARELHECFCFSKFLANYAEDFEDNNQEKRNTLRADECEKYRTHWFIKEITCMLYILVENPSFDRYGMYVHNRFCARISLFFFPLTIKPVLKHFTPLRTRLPVV